jgi:hypothetical protein
VPPSLDVADTPTEASESTAKYSSRHAEFFSIHGAAHADFTSSSASAACSRSDSLVAWRILKQVQDDGQAGVDHHEKTKPL